MSGQYSPAKKCEYGKESLERPQKASLGHLQANGGDSAETSNAHWRQKDSAGTGPGLTRTCLYESAP